MQDVIDLRAYGISIANLFRNLKQRDHKNEGLRDKFTITKIVQVEIKDRIDAKQKKSFTQGHKITFIRKEKAKELIAYLENYLKLPKRQGNTPNKKYYESIIEVLKKESSITQ